VSEHPCKDCPIFTEGMEFANCESCPDLPKRKKCEPSLDKFTKPEGDKDA
jgi:hypothetical protein